MRLCRALPLRSVRQRRSDRFHGQAVPACQSDGLQCHHGLDWGGNARQVSRSVNWDVISVTTASEFAWLILVCKKEQNSLELDVTTRGIFLCFPGWMKWSGAGMSDFLRHDHAINQPIIQWTRNQIHTIFRKLINQSINQSINRSILKLKKYPDNQSINRSWIEKY